METERFPIFPLLIYLLGKPSINRVEMDCYSQSMEVRLIMKFTVNESSGNKFGKATNELHEWIITILV